MASPTVPGYERLSHIGTGGFSRVYQGEQAKLKRTVAIKVLNFGLSDETDRRSFERECELMGRVSTHPNIVTVHDTEFTSDGHPCIVMEHYPGGSLADLIAEIGKLNAPEALEVGVAIAAALEASHQAGVLHCDLKPQNILISEFGQPALGDFGISTFAGERTHTGDAGAGFTLAYAAPEILEGASPSVTSDVYSLAATLYTSLAGRRPFFHLNSDGERPIPSEQARRILLETPPSLVAEGVPRELDELIAQAMAKEAKDRPATAADFAFALYEVGRVLGLDTSLPRVADGAGLLGLFGEQVDEVDEIDDTKLLSPTLDLTQLRRQRHVDVAAPAVDPNSLLDETSAAPRPASPLPTASIEVDEARKLRSAGFVLVSLVVAAVILFLVVGRGESGDVADDVPTTSAPIGVAVNPVIAPDQPTNVSLAHVDNNRAAVLWTVPGGVDPTSDVSYEVRRQGNSAVPLVTNTSFLVLDEVGSSSATCVTVLSVRSNRTSTATSPVCLGSVPAISIMIAPSKCSAPNCSLAFSVAGGTAADDAVILLDATNTPVDAIIEFGPDGVSGEITLPADAALGLYLVLIEADGRLSGTTLTVE